MRVSDDGAGFDPDRTQGKGMGLSIMRYRARMIGANIDFQRNTPSGIVVTCSLLGATSAPAENENQT